MISALSHRGPDGLGKYINPGRIAGFGHNRLSIIDLTQDGAQPMHDGTLTITYNGEIYNYIELRQQLRDDHNFKTQSDTEVILASYKKWGKACLSKFIGMFAFAIWNESTQELFAARDRFGVKPFYYAQLNDQLFFASEIKAIHAAGIEKIPDSDAWATYFSSGLYDHGPYTFWKNIMNLRPGHSLFRSRDGQIQTQEWYHLSDVLMETDERSERIVKDELAGLLEETVKLRFRSDVPVGVCLSGGLDSSLLFALIKKIKGNDFPIHAFTFYTGDIRYDEHHKAVSLTNSSKAIHHLCRLDPHEIEALSGKISRQMDEPYGGFPTLGMTKVFEEAKKTGTTVLLDGNGLDEGWAGYEYYRNPDHAMLEKGPVQGSAGTYSLKSCSKIETKRAHFSLPFPAKDSCTLLQYRDLMHTKIPRAMRFSDRNAMKYSLEVREPFLDHRLVELGLKQPLDRKIRNNKGKYLVREVAESLIPHTHSHNHKQSVQTPQREWLGNELKGWADQQIHLLLTKDEGNWFDQTCVKEVWKNYLEKKPDNSFPIWQLINANQLLNEV